jgi:hypothetical protein
MVAAVPASSGVSGPGPSSAGVKAWRQPTPVCEVPNCHCRQPGWPRYPARLLPWPRLSGYKAAGVIAGPRTSAHLAQLACLCCFEVRPSAAQLQGHCRRRPDTYPLTWCGGEEVHCFPGGAAVSAASALAAVGVWYCVARLSCILASFPVAMFLLFAVPWQTIEGWHCSTVLPGKQLLMLLWQLVDLAPCRLRLYKGFPFTKSGGLSTRCRCVFVSCVMQRKSEIASGE